MSVFDVLDEMDDLLDNAKAFPLAAHKIVIDGDRLRELVNDIRLAMPKEMKRAQTIDYDCDRIMKEAQANAETIIRGAEDRAKALVSSIPSRKKPKSAHMRFWQKPSPSVRIRRMQPQHMSCSR